MRKGFKKLNCRAKRISAVLGLGALLHAQYALAQGNQTRLEAEPIGVEEVSKTAQNTSYIVGPGDGLNIEVVDVAELSGNFSIAPDGVLYLPRLRAVNVEGLTVEEIEDFLTIEFKKYVIDPQVFVRPIAYRPIRVYVGGEVKRPGYYTLSGNQITISNNYNANSLNNKSKVLPLPFLEEKFGNDGIRQSLGIQSSRFSVFPTVFDAIQSAQGITPYSNLAQVLVTRRQPKSQGAGRKRTELNFLSLITSGDESQNIRLFDGDVVKVSKSQTVLRDQLIQAGRSNLTPEFMQVFVTGRVEEPGVVVLPQGSTLLHAINLAGGPKVIHGRVEFIRFNQSAEIDRRIFSLKRDAPLNDYRNPVLTAGDVIRIKETPISKSLSVLDELSRPVVTSYSLYSLFNNFTN